MTKSHPHCAHTEALFTRYFQNNSEVLNEKYNGFNWLNKKSEKAFAILWKLSTKVQTSSAKADYPADTLGRVAIPISHKDIACSWFCEASKHYEDKYGQHSKHCLSYHRCQAGLHKGCSAVVKPMS